MRPYMPTHELTREYDGEEVMSGCREDALAASSYRATFMFHPQRTNFAEIEILEQFKL